MAYNKKLADRIRKALSGFDVEEKNMFGGLAFLVKGKMCINVSGDDLMCRIDPAIHDEVTQKKGCRAVFMKGREYKGYVYIDETGIKNEEDFKYWVNLAVEFNDSAKASRKKSK